MVALFGLVDAAEVFSGFGHPAIITVAAMLIISYVMETSGVVAFLARGLEAIAVGSVSTLAVLMGTVAVLSGFMNNIGALVLMLPVAVHLARAQGVHGGAEIVVANRPHADTRPSASCPSAYSSHSLPLENQ